jgi:hypothetical protein
LRHDPPEGVRRHTEAPRHPDASDPRQLARLRALAADDRDLRLVGLLKTQHVPLAHRSASEAVVSRCISAGCGAGRRFCAVPRALRQALRLSPRTVGHHLYRAFPKLGISSRTELADLLAS